MWVASTPPCVATTSVEYVQWGKLCSSLWRRGCVMAGLGPSIKPILVDTFIELFVEVVNKLKHKNKDIGDIFDDLPESDEVIIED